MSSGLIYLTWIHLAPLQIRQVGSLVIVAFLDKGMHNFRDQIGRFRQVVAAKARKQLGTARKILQEGEFTGTAGGNVSTPAMSLESPGGGSGAGNLNADEASASKRQRESEIARQQQEEQSQETGNTRSQQKLGTEGN